MGMCSYQSFFQISLCGFLLSLISKCVLQKGMVMVGRMWWLVMIMLPSAVEFGIGYPLVSSLCLNPFMCSHRFGMEAHIRGIC